MDNPPIHTILHSGHPLPSNGTINPASHLRRLKGHSIGLIAKPIWLMSPMLPKVAHGGLNLSWWYDKISYAPVPSAVRPFRRQANSDFRWPIGHFHSDGWGDGVIGPGMGSGVASTCMEVLWKFLGFLSGPFLFFFFSFLSWNHLPFLHVLCLLSRNSKFPSLFLF